MTKPDVEILAPAGSYESLKAAIASGADAVYLGGSMFGARAYAANFDETQLKEAIDYVHVHGKKLFLTVNTLLKDEEIEAQLYDYLAPLYQWGLDAVLVQDLGVLKFIRNHFPELPIHTSTQMTLNHALSAKFYKELGVERVVVSRELSLDEIHQIVEETGLEVESFVHGALCYCYSGQCLYSSMIGGRSGNRGQCAQPCRLPYQVGGKKNKEYIMSLKDVCTLKLIPEMVEAGIYSFKIEGRMKRPEYVALVTAMYRKYTDLYLEKGKDGYKVEPDDIRKLMDLYNRGGFTEGYYHKHNGADMLCLDRPNHAGVPALRITSVEGRYAYGQAVEELHPGDVLELPKDSGNYTIGESFQKGQKVKLSLAKNHVVRENMVLSRTKNQYLIDEIRQVINQKKQEKINGKLILSVNKDATLELDHGDFVVSVSGPKAQEAKNQPMDEARVLKQMNKTGNSEFIFGKLDIELEGHVFYPMQQLNDLRHRGMDGMQQTICESYRRMEQCKGNERIHNNRTDSQHISREKLFSVCVEQKHQLYKALQKKYIGRIYLDANIVSQSYHSEECRNMVKEIQEHGKEAYYGFPHVFRQNAAEVFEHSYNRWLSIGFDGVLVRNVETFAFLKEHQYDGKIVLDHHVYTFNVSSQNFWLDKEVEMTTSSLELNYRELKDLNLSRSEIVIYGYSPMMVTANCIQKTIKGCNCIPSYQSITDRVQKQFYVKNCCDYCYNIIYNSSCLSLIDQQEELEELAPHMLRISFTSENQEITEKVLDAFERTFIQGMDEQMPEQEYTRGHFKRGIK